MATLLGTLGFFLHGNSGLYAAFSKARYQAQVVGLPAAKFETHFRDSLLREHDSKAVERNFPPRSDPHPARLEDLQLRDFPQLIGVDVDGRIWLKEPVYIDLLPVAIGLNQNCHHHKHHFHEDETYAKIFHCTVSDYGI